MAKQKEDILSVAHRKAPSPQADAKVSGRKAQADMIGFILAKVAELTAQQIARGPLDLQALDSYIKTVEHGLGGLRNARDALGREK
jgi:hypothetical protein